MCVTLLSNGVVRSGPYFGWMADDKRLELRVSDSWLARLDEARGVTRRGTFVKLVLEEALGGIASGLRQGKGPSVSQAAPPASPRGPVDEVPLPKIAPRRQF